MARLLVLVAVVLVLSLSTGGWGAQTGQEAPWRIHTLFSVECQNYFDWQTVGLMHSFKKARQPGPITRLLSCTDDEKKNYRGMNLAPTLEVPSMSRHPELETGEGGLEVEEIAPQALVHGYILCFHVEKISSSHLHSSFQHLLPLENVNSNLNIWKDAHILLVGLLEKRAF
ncbi:Peptidyl serine alpha-galactosyltransferase [Vitis vinifera]|uniref:Peptidyl serine alpha-galactosyltransferase n=1 Tax=Vitis vinifera TaxID=29760 RepID=A0A438G9Z0_VITVI|nr:Peptidyl serine alpha-galactosyltransferase [Vitis vinifera]